MKGVVIRTANLVIVPSSSIGDSFDNIACDSPCVEHVVQLNNATCRSQAIDVIAAQRQLATQGAAPNRLETLLGVSNEAWHAPSADTGNPPPRSATSTRAGMSAMVGRVASGLFGIALLP